MIKIAVKEKIVLVLLMMSVRIVILLMVVVHHVIQDIIWMIVMNVKNAMKLVIIAQEQTKMIALPR